MPRESNNPKGRLNLAVSESTKKQIAGLKKFLDADSQTEVVRRAVQLYAEMLLAKRAGKRLLIVDKDDRKTELTLG